MIHWISRYSETLEDDKQGRWARIGYVGEGMEGLEVALIKKISTNKFNKAIQETLTGLEFIFVTDFMFPRKGEIMFNTLDEAKEQVRIDLENFKKLLK